MKKHLFLTSLVALVATTAVAKANQYDKADLNLAGESVNGVEYDEGTKTYSVNPTTYKYMTWNGEKFVIADDELKYTEDASAATYGQIASDIPYASANDLFVSETVDGKNISRYKTAEDLSSYKMEHDVGAVGSTGYNIINTKIADDIDLYGNTNFIVQASDYVAVNGANTVSYTSLAQKATKSGEVFYSKSAQDEIMRQIGLTLGTQPSSNIDARYVNEITVKNSNVTFVNGEKQGDDTIEYSLTHEGETYHKSNDLWYDSRNVLAEAQSNTTLETAMNTYDLVVGVVNSLVSDMQSNSTLAGDEGDIFTAMQSAYEADAAGIKEVRDYYAQFISAKKIHEQNLAAKGNAQSRYNSNVRDAAAIYAANQALEEAPVVDVISAFADEAELRANAHADAGDALTLSQAKAYADAGDALTLQQANAYTDAQVETLEKNISGGVAAATALSAVEVSNVKKGEMSVGGGYGYYNGESAGAFGMAMGLSDNWSVNAGAGVASGDKTQVSFRAGTNYKFKLF